MLSAASNRGPSKLMCILNELVRLVKGAVMHLHLMKIVSIPSLLAIAACLLSLVSSFPYSNV